MRNIIDGYVGILVIMLLVTLCLAFTTINLDITAAKKIYNDVVSEIENTDGAILDTDKYSYNNDNDTYTYTKKAENNAYVYTITVKREDIGSEITDTGQTFIYNSIYKVNMKYQYFVPLFGRQTYVTGGYTK